MLDKIILVVLTIGTSLLLHAQEAADPAMLTIDRIYQSGEFRQDRSPQMRWINDGTQYTTLERSEQIKGGRDIVAYDTESAKRSK